MTSRNVIGKPEKQGVTNTSESIYAEYFVSSGINPENKILLVKFKFFAKFFNWP